MISKYRSSTKMLIATLIGIYLFMLLMNLLTPMLADDYQYYFSFKTKEPIQSVEQIPPSMIAHGKMINGRYFSHGIVQFFLMLPPIVFDLVNSAVFVATVAIAYRMCNKGQKTDNLLLLALFGAYWLFQWDFGQVNLWLDGSCNYLFALFFSLLFLLPYLYSVRYNKNIHPLWLLLHLPLSFLVGGYLEMTAVGFVGAAVLFVLADLFLFKKWRSLLLVPSILSSLAGFAFMAFAPAQRMNKMSDFSFLNMLTTFGVAMLVLASVFPLIIFFICRFRAALREKCDKRILVTAIIVALGALASNFVLIFAKYYALRCSVAFIFLSVLATGILYCKDAERAHTVREKKFIKLFALFLVLALCLGLADNIRTAVQFYENEQKIEEALENGEREVTLECPVPLTKYNGLMGITYLNTKGHERWPNPFFARYYGLDRVYATTPLPEPIASMLSP